MIRIETHDAEGKPNYTMLVYGEVDNGIVRRRYLGQVYRYPGQGYESWVRTDNGSRNIGDTMSVPEAIQVILDYHKLTDHAYAPWPDMEDDEE